MDIATLVFAAICAVGSIITTIPVVLGWLRRRRGATVTAGTTPSKARWALVLSLSICALIFSCAGLYRTFRYGDYRNWQSSKQETIYAKSFLNETVEIDGKIFDRCHFENVKLLYHGRAPVSFTRSDFKGEIYLGSDNIAINQFMITSSALDQLKGLIRVHNWVQMDSNGNPISVQ